jgi:hypothetical protein
MGTRIKLSNGRRLVDDVINMASKMPTAGMSGDFDVKLASKFRRISKPRISWNVLYMKAYACVSAEFAELRRSYVKFPWPHIYEHQYNVCMMTISREYQGEERLFFARFNRPDEQSLVELQKQYDIYRRSPVEEIKQFRHQMNFAKLPTFVRRFGWWCLYNVWPEKRASHMGTFGMSFSGYKGAYGSKHLGPNTTTIGVDPFPRKGVAKTLLTFDHRIIDGTPVTKVLQRLHHILNTSIRVELAQLAGVDPETAEPFTEEQLLAFKKQKRLERIGSNRRKTA